MKKKRNIEAKRGIQQFDVRAMMLSKAVPCSAFFFHEVKCYFYSFELAKISFIFILYDSAFDSMTMEYLYILYDSALDYDYSSFYEQGVSQSGVIITFLFGPFTLLPIHHHDAHDD